MEDFALHKHVARSPVSGRGASIARIVLLGKLSYGRQGHSVSPVAKKTRYVGLILLLKVPAALLHIL